MKINYRFFILFFLSLIFLVGTFFITLQYINFPLLPNKKETLEKKVGEENKPKKERIIEILDHSKYTHEKIGSDIISQSRKIDDTIYIFLEKNKISEYENPDYVIYYFLKKSPNGEIKPEGSVRIILQKKPFEELRALAEKDFLDKLALTKEDACQLDISETILFEIDPEHGGVDFGLSFCENSL
ncbi:MAG: hypothetical protein IPN70_02590 [Candidatus Moraniibacteriota bacterium]|nr:MAG: hypothetical protein IPN70_02590 [Candidatus Moranbacteria bacterium]